MAETLLQRLDAALQQEGLKPGTNKAMAWLRQQTRNLTPSRQALMKDREHLRDKTIIGRMFHYFYDPKLKKELPTMIGFPW